MRSRSRLACKPRKTSVSQEWPTRAVAVAVRLLTSRFVLELDKDEKAQLDKLNKYLTAKSV